MGSSAYVITGFSHVNFSKALEILRSGASLFRVDEAHDIEDLRNLVHRRCAESFHTIVIAGGDGTISRILDCVIDSECSLGLLPCGYGNDFARSLGIPLDIEKAAHTILLGTIKTVDVGMIGDATFFMNVCGIGLDATVSAIFNKQNLSPH